MLRRDGNFKLRSVGWRDRPNDGSDRLQHLPGWRGRVLSGTMSCPSIEPTEWRLKTELGPQALVLRADEVIQ